MQAKKRFLFYIIVAFLLANTNIYSEEKKYQIPVDIKIGVVKDIDAQVLEYIKNDLQTKYNIKLEIIRFSNVISANKAVSEDIIDGNIAQTEPYFTTYSEEYKYNIYSVGKVYIKPIGLYSKKYKNLASLPKDATVILLESDIDDKTILARELLLLQKSSLLTLNRNIKIPYITLFDVIHDSRQVLFKNALTNLELLDSYYKNGSDLFVLEKNLTSKIKENEGNLLFSEDVTSIFPIILVVKMDSKNIKYLNQIYDVITSSDTSNYILETYHGDLIPIKINWNII